MDTIAVLVAALVICIGLGYWSHKRYHARQAASGDVKRGGIKQALIFGALVILGIYILGKLLG